MATSVWRRFTNLLVTGAAIFRRAVTVEGTLTVDKLRLSNTVWDDLQFPATRQRQGATGKPDFDFTNVGLLFPQNDATEIAYSVGQFSHSKKPGTDISPHVHYVQDEAEVPVFKMDYRWYINGGDPTGSFTTISTSGQSPVFTYTSGSIAQILPFPDIDGSGVATDSSLLDIKFYRDDNVVTGDILVKELDIHYEIDSLGSDTEFGDS